MLQAWVVGGRCHIMTSLIILDRVIQHERRFDKVCMGFNLPLTSPFAGRVLMVFGPVFFLLLSPRSQRQNDHTCHTYWGTHHRGVTVFSFCIKLINGSSRHCLWNLLVQWNRTPSRLQRFVTATAALAEAQDWIWASYQDGQGSVEWGMVKRGKTLGWFLNPVPLAIARPEMKKAVQSSEEFMDRALVPVQDPPKEICPADIQIWLCKMCCPQMWAQRALWFVAVLYWFVISVMLSNRSGQWD